MNTFEFFVARRYLWAQRRSLSSGLIALFSALGVTIGTWLLIFVLSASNGFEQEVKNQLIGRDAHFEVTRYYYEPMADYDDVYQYISTLPQVVAASPFIMSQAVFTKKDKFSGGVVFGIDPVLSQGVIGLKNYLKWGTYQFDSLKDDNDKVYHGVIMGYALAYRLGLEVGDKCFLNVFGEGVSLGPGMAPRIQPLILSATFESGMYQFDESLAYISLDAAQQAFNMSGLVTGIHAKVKDPLTSHIVAAQIKDSLGYPYTTIDWKEKNRTLIKWMDIEKLLFGLALGIIIIIAAFNIISSLVMNVNDKTREIGILRAMGATRLNILRVFILEGLFIGFAGSLLGMGLGLLSCYVQLEYGLFKLPGDVYFVSVLPIQVEWLDIVMVLVLTNFLCMTAAIIPAFKAASQKPVEAIRHE